VSNDLLEQLGICGVYEAMKGQSASHALIKGVTREVKVRRDVRILQCADPGHLDDHPSFLVNDRTNRFKCLARGQSGGMLDMVRLVSGLAGASNGQLMEILRERAAGKTDLRLQPAPDSRFSGSKWVKLDNERLTATFDYRDVNGVMVYQVLRFEGTHEGARAKRFSQRRPLPAGGMWLREGNEWVYRTADGTAAARSSALRSDGTERVEPRRPWAYDLDEIHDFIPYRLAELLADCALGRVIFVVEGELLVDVLRSLGFAATTNSGGTGFTYPLHWERFFHGAAAVYVIPDCDDTGRFAAKERVLHLRGGAPVLEVLDVWPWRSDKYDVVNYVRELPRMTQRERAATLAATLNTAIDRLGTDYPRADSKLLAKTA
jgi:hypothetical protein